MARTSVATMSAAARTLYALKASAIAGPPNRTNSPISAITVRSSESEYPAVLLVVASLPLVIGSLLAPDRVRRASAGNSQGGCHDASGSPWRAQTHAPHGLAPSITAS